MITLAISIAFSVAVSIFLKISRNCRIQIDQAIAINYVVASALTLGLFSPPLDTVSSLPLPAWIILGLLGVLLPAVFLIMAAAVRQAGIVLSDAAQRMSLVLPIVAAFLVFHEVMSGRKATGIALALCALLCLITRPHKATPAPTVQDAANSGTRHAGTRATWAVLLGVWMGYGIIDILFKQMARLGTGFTQGLMLSFVLAAILMFLWLLTANKTRWDARSLASGVLLGALNFGNIYFYIRAHQTFPHNPTLVFAAMNIGVISIGTLAGAGFFRERLTRVHIAGIALALVAVVTLFPH
ncbi:MAG TPA: EamA/RhaT family transporter [Castellaniella sp.]|uniref:EamA/RhaT family transporter n=1 Tax=Castellaniella sp. TaxID=1955812 RepID=UPI002F244365